MHDISLFDFFKKLSSLKLKRIIQERLTSVESKWRGVQKEQKNSQKKVYLGQKFK